MRGLGVQGALYARKLIEELSISDPKSIDLDVIAAKLNVEISEAEVDGFDGAIQKIQEPKCGIITVRRSIRERVQKRFVIAHELGHYQIPDHWEEESLCTITYLGYGPRWARRSEFEANEFAAELLMPEALFRPRLRSHPPSLDAIRRLAEEFNTSLTATAVQYVRLTDRPCAVIVSREGRIRWYQASATFRCRVRVGEALDPRSCASEFFRERALPDAARPVLANAWIKSLGAAADVRINEHSLALPCYNTVLTLLYTDAEP